MHKSIYISLLFLFCVANIHAQPTLDSIKLCLKQKPHFYGKFDSHWSFIDNSRAKIIGVKAGLSFGKRISFAIGYNQLQQPAHDFNKTVYINTVNNEQVKKTASLHLYYFSIQTEYIFYQTKHWELSLPLQLGAGKSYYSCDNYLGKKMMLETSNNLIYEPGVSVEYKFLRWFGVGADFGYRFMFSDYNHLNRGFTAPTVAFKYLIYFDEIIKTFFPGGLKEAIKKIQLDKDTLLKK